MNNICKIPVINSHNSWSRLQEVWLGDVYPSSWYSHLDSQTQDVFVRLTEITQQDLNSIQKTLESFGITVRRPAYESIDLFVDNNDQLVKPQICPRDHFVVVGNSLIGHAWQFTAWDRIANEYATDANCTVVKSTNHYINGANVVRIGRDIIIDSEDSNFVYNNEFPEYRVQTVSNGGHMDGCFAVLKPGLVLVNNYYPDYQQTFPNWETILLTHPTYSTHQSRKTPAHNGKFYNTAVGSNQMFNDHVVKHALNWVGNYTETYFELNCLVVDEQNVVMLAENEKLANALVKHGITVHWVPFRTRSFWDGGVHCLTVDIRRQSVIEDFFPERK
jgi:hypothetical protein